MKLKRQTRELKKIQRQKKGISTFTKIFTYDVFTFIQLLRYRVHCNQNFGIKNNFIKKILYRKYYMNNILSGINSLKKQFFVLTYFYSFKKNANGRK